MVRIREKLKINPENLLALHALSGNDTVGACHGICKGKALKLLREHGSLSFNLLGDLSCDFDAFYSMAVQFLSLCYRIKPEDQQSSISYHSNKNQGLVQEGIYKHPITIPL